MTEFKTGDIVRIKPFDANNRCNTVICIDEMTKEIGKLHVITNKTRYHGVFNIDDKEHYYYPAEILELVENDTPVFYFGEFPVAVTYDGDYWRTAAGEIVSCFDVGLSKPGVAKLSYDIYNVGSKGADVEVLEYKGTYWLSPKYLPMSGMLEMGDDYAF